MLRTIRYSFRLWVSFRLTGLRMLNRPITPLFAKPQRKILMTRKCSVSFLFPFHSHREDKPRLQTLAMG
jgi:hypothetical protein